jgi:hypothetical protein
METSENAVEEKSAVVQEKETLDEKLPGLFEPDTLLPIQYFEAMRRKHLLEGEKRLILSVLEDAIECFMKCIDSPTNKGQKLFRDAEEWINLQDKHWVFSFDNVCDMLDIHPEYMRRGLRAWKEKKLASISRKAEAARIAAEQPQPAPSEEASAPVAVAKVVHQTDRPNQRKIVAAAKSSRHKSRLPQRARA